MSELWSAQQRDWLQAMGHAPMVLAGAAPVAAEPAAALESPAQPPSRPASRDGGERAQRAPEPAASSRHSTSEPARGPSTPRGADALLRNLARAARRDVADPALQALFDAQALRDPAAKRALWPRLRALRRGGVRG